MTCRMYVCGELQHPREKRHMDLMLKSLSDKYETSHNECIVFISGTIHFQLGDGTRIDQKIDAIVIKDNRVVLLELKNIKGDVLADCSGSLWVVDGEPLPPRENSINPFVQVRRER